MSLKYYVCNLNPYLAILSSVFLMTFIWCESYMSTWLDAIRKQAFTCPNIHNAHALIARFMGTAWGPPGDDRTQVGPMLVPWILLSWWWQESLFLCALKSLDSRAFHYDLFMGCDMIHTLHNMMPGMLVTIHSTGGLMMACIYLVPKHMVLVSIRRSFHGWRVELWKQHSCRRSSFMISLEMGIPIPGKTTFQ